MQTDTGGAMKSMTWLVGMLVLLVAGCAIDPVGSDGRRAASSLNAQQVRGFKAGASTKADVERALGKPHSVNVFANLSEEAWDYGYYEGSIRMLAQFHFDMNGNYKYHAERYIGRSWLTYN
jgi:outer membrane protein assembly factor BamE (lipoprotein component of BamABCDE complex)